MSKTFYIIIISVFAFIAVNTIFYYDIYKTQLNFQTDLLSKQIKICGNTIEQYGLNFENEVNFILFSENITQLFNDTDIKDKGSKNLELFYAKYNKLINKIIIYDKNKNVFSLILDKKNNFVSDYYESQQQITLYDRDQLFQENGNFYFVIPIFSNNEVQSNILIEIIFERYINSVFEQYKLENTLWQWIITDQGELISTDGKSLIVQPSDLQKISNQILEANEGFLIHTLKTDDQTIKVVSVYYPVRLVRKDFGIIFSIETDLFLESLIHKFQIITAASLLLIILIFFINFSIIKVKSREASRHKLSEQALLQLVDLLPLGAIIANPDGNVRILNQAAIDLLLLSKNEDHKGKAVNQLFPKDVTESEDLFYGKVFGKGTLLHIQKDNQEIILYKKEWIARPGQDEVKIMLLFDVTYLEKNRKVERIATIAKSGLLNNMQWEISAPLKTIKQAIQEFSHEKLTPPLKENLELIIRSTDLLENLIKAILDFSMLEAGKAVLEQIPFVLRNEISLAIDSFKHHTNGKNISIITKIRSDIPDKLIGDPFRLRQVINNCLENAFDTTREGRILISAELMEHRQDHVKIKFQIEDSGKGIPQDIIENYLGVADISNDTGKGQHSELGLRIAIMNQLIELMSGSLRIETPSCISTHPDYPGTKYLFNIEVTTDPIYSKQLNFSSIRSFSDIQCLVLSQVNDPEEAGFQFLNELGIALKHRIYRDDNLNSIIEFLQERKSTFHLLLILDKKESGGFTLASKLYEENLADYFLIIMVSSNHIPGNNLHARKYHIDQYLVQPFESNRLYEIIKDRFTGLTNNVLKDAPKGIKINPNLSILLAEDNLFNRKLAQALFKRLGFEITLAENGNEVLEQVKKNKFDIIFMDILMPEKDGIEAAKEIRDMGFNTPIIAISAVENEDTRKSARSAGIVEYIVKPANIEKIRNILLKLFPDQA